MTKQNPLLLKKNAFLHILNCALWASILFSLGLNLSSFQLAPFTLLLLIFNLSPYLLTLGTSWEWIRHPSPPPYLLTSLLISSSIGSLLLSLILSPTFHTPTLPLFLSLFSHSLQHSLLYYWQTQNHYQRLIQHYHIKNLLLLLTLLMATLFPQQIFPSIWWAVAIIYLFSLFPLLPLPPPSLTINLSKTHQLLKNFGYWATLSFLLNWSTTYIDRFFIFQNHGPVFAYHIAWQFGFWMAAPFWGFTPFILPYFIKNLPTTPNPSPNFPLPLLLGWISLTALIQTLYLTKINYPELIPISAIVCLGFFIQKKTLEEWAKIFLFLHIRKYCLLSFFLFSLNLATLLLFIKKIGPLGGALNFTLIKSIEYLICLATKQTQLLNCLKNI